MRLILGYSIALHLYLVWTLCRRGIERVRMQETIETLRAQVQHEQKQHKRTLRRMRQHLLDFPTRSDPSPTLSTASSLEAQGSGKLGSPKPGQRWTQG